MGTIFYREVCDTSFNEYIYINLIDSIISYLIKNCVQIKLQSIDKKLSSQLVDFDH